MIQTATADIVTSALTTDQKKYLDYTIKYSDGTEIEQYDKLPAGTTETITVKLLFKNDESVNPSDLPSTNQVGISLSYSTNYVQADNNAKARNRYLRSATIKVDGNTVGNANVKLSKSSIYAISLDEGMEDVTYASSNTNVATVDNTGSIEAINTGTSTITLTGQTSGDERYFTVEVETESIPIGSYVNYSTTLNGVTLDGWRVFYVDGDYTYIILDDYLPRAAISSDLRTTYNLESGMGWRYAIKSTTSNRTEFINSMATTSNWSDLINNGEIDGTPLSAEVKSNVNVWAKGAPDIELWANSWNSASNEFTTTITLSQAELGYRVNGTIGVEILGVDKSKATYSLYFPNSEKVDSCQGYFLASPSYFSMDYVMSVNCAGAVGIAKYMVSNADWSNAFRPVVCLPTAVTKALNEIVGDTVSYTTTLNGVTLDDWEVFYRDGDYTYIILDDYLPRAAISSDLRTNYNLADGDGSTYAIKSTTGNRTEFINAMATTSNWSDLINNGEIDGIPLSAEVKSNANVCAKGAPDIELWANSWNSKGNRFAVDIIPEYYGEVLEMQSEDKSKETYSLYFPYSSVVDSCYGYWIASPSDNGGEYVRAEVYADWVSCGSCTEGVLAFRPVICLPSSLIK